MSGDDINVLVQELIEASTPTADLRAKIDAHVMADPARTLLREKASRMLADHPSAASGFGAWPLDEPISHQLPQPGFCACPPTTITATTIEEYVTFSARANLASLQMASRCECPRPQGPPRTAPLAVARVLDRMVHRTLATPADLGTVR